MTMTQVGKRALEIHPPEDLIKRFPEIKRAAHVLSLNYVHRDIVSEDQLRAMGRMLWQAVEIDKTFDELHRYAGNKVLAIEVHSDDPAIQNLPWETLYHPEKGFLGWEEGFTLSRVFANVKIETETVPSGPLRVLLFSSLPDDLDGEQGRLNVEEEQEKVLEALMGQITAGTVELHMPDDGRFTTFERMLKQLQPHMVFLSGHGHFYQNDHSDEPSYGSFLFENNEGLSLAVKDEELAKTFKGSGVRCVVLSACESGKAASDALNTGLVRHLTAQQLPHVIGMRESVFDRAGILFAQTFCESMAQAQRVDVALQEARRAIITSTWRDQDLGGLAEQSLEQWSLPALYSRDPGQALIDWDFEPVQKTTAQHYRLDLKGVSLPKKFRGRRKELRKLLHRFLSGELTQLLITGPGGQGKTALAGKLALELKKSNKKLFAWSAQPGKSWPLFLLGLKLELKGEYSDRYEHFAREVSDSSLHPGYLLEMLLNQFKGELVIFLDNLESLQNAKDRQLEDASLSAFINAAQQLSQQGLHFLLTSRWLIPQWPEQQHWPLERLSYGDFLQLCLLSGDRLNALVDRKARLRRVYQTLNGNGRGLEFFAAAVQGMSVKEEDDFLNKLSQAEIELQTNMALNEVLAQRSDAELELLQCLQCYDTPVPTGGVIKLSDTPDQTPQLLEALLSVSLVDQSYNSTWLCDEYHCSELVSKAVDLKRQCSLNKRYYQRAADYQAYLFRNERRTLDQAIVVYHAKIKAGSLSQAHRFALDTIVGPLNLAGRYQTLIEDWLPALCQSDDQQIQSEALGQLGKQHLHTGDYETALSYLKQSLAIRQEIGDRSGEGTTLNNISQIYDARGDYETALSYLKQSLAIQQEIGDASGLCATLFNIGHIHWNNEEQTEALEAWLTVYKLARQINLAQALEALEDLGKQFGLEGLSGWENLLKQWEENENNQ